MTEEQRPARRSQALEPELIIDPQLKAEAEAANGLRQYDYAVRSVYQALERHPFKLRPSLIYSFHREALQGISAYAGLPRPADVEIQGSKHEPVGAHLVPELVEDLCEYINDNWETATPVHLAAYVMWRLNWIHPFADGNGRTSRILSFFVLSTKLRLVLPGTPTYVELVIQHRTDYEDALDRADEAWLDGQRVDVSAMEKLIEALLAKQLAKVYEMAAGSLPLQALTQKPVSDSK
jgi:fido (protein-threonine AMPylation protein)